MPIHEPSYGERQEYDAVANVVVHFSRNVPAFFFLGMEESLRDPMKPICRVLFREHQITDISIELLIGLFLDAAHGFPQENVSKKLHLATG